MAAFVGWIAGMMIGASLFEMEGLVVLGLAGLIGGFAWDRRRKQAEREEDLERARYASTRLESKLEARLDRLEARLAKLEGATDAQGTVPGPVVPAAPTVVRRAETRTTAPLQGTPPAMPPLEPIPARAVPAGAAIPPASVPPRDSAPPARPGRSPRPNPLVASLTGGNTIVRVGVVILFIGLAFLVKYAADRRILPDELKVAMVGAAGVALLLVGWRLRSLRRGYALSLQGAGVAVLYLTVLGAMRLYGMIPAPAAFVVLALIAVFAATLAVAQDALALAIIGAGGGFLAPLLVSTGEGDHVTLFSYYLVLNAGLVLIAWRRAWRALNVLGFAFTFVIGAAWGVTRYDPRHFASAESFLVAFFVLYVAIAVLFARREASRARRYVDGTITFGTPIAAFGLQAGLVRGVEFGLAYSSLALSATYVLLAWALQRAGRERFRLLADAFLAMGVVFATLAIPLALDARWTSAAWALEGMAIHWVGVRQRTPLTRTFAIALQVFAGIAFAIAYPGLQDGRPATGAAFVGALLIALAAFGTNRLAHRLDDEPAAGELARWERDGLPLLFAWGLGWLLFAALHEIDTFVPVASKPVALVAALALIASAFGWLARRWHWREAGWPMLGYVPFLAVVALGSSVAMAHPFAGLGWLAWPAALIAQALLLRALEPAEGPRRRWFAALHVLTVLLVAGLGAWELGWVAARVTADGTAWTAAAVVLVPAALVYWITHVRVDAQWPITGFAAAYRAAAAPVLVAALGAWSVAVNLAHDGRSDPLPYVPLLNAIDLAHAIVALTVVSFWLGARRTGQPSTVAFRSRTFRAVAAALTFLWLNAILLRSIHHWAGIAYRPEPLMESVLVQSALSVFWALLALAIMFFATRRAWRAPWLAGAGLMAVVVVKLVLVDLSRATGVERIVSFIGVGVLMLVVGWVSPVPPRPGDPASGAGAEGVA